MQSAERRTQNAECMLQHAHPLSPDCWNILDRLRQGGWRARSVDLHGYRGMLNYRGRISDLRIKHLIAIETMGHRDAQTGRLHTTYYVPAHAVPRAEWAWLHRSVEGYEPLERQRMLALMDTE